MSLSTLLNDTVYKYSVSSSQNDLGEWVTSTATSSSIACRYSQPSTDEIMLISGKYDKFGGVIYISFDTNVSVGDKLVYDGNSLYVNEVIHDSSNTYKKLIVSRM